jgi:putative transposase
VYAVQKDIWHLRGNDRTIVEQLLSYPNQALKVVGNKVRLPLGNKRKEHFAKGQKPEVKMGVKSNQNFVQIPIAKVKERWQQECELRGWRFVAQEEDYRSKTSFLDRDLLPAAFGEKPDSWQPSGKGIKRGLYRLKAGLILNADVNGAANIICKAKVAPGSMLRLSSATIETAGRGLLTNPLSIKLEADSSPKVFP